MHGGRNVCNAHKKLYDVVRIDHFRGFESFWAVPFGETTAENGRWLPAPGMDFVNAVKKKAAGIIVHCGRSRFPDAGGT